MDATHELELFMKPTCPYCIKVMNFMDENSITIPLRERQVPCLFIDGKPLYESGDIIEWLRDNTL